MPLKPRTSAYKNKSKIAKKKISLYLDESRELSARHHTKGERSLNIKESLDLDADIYQL